MMTKAEEIKALEAIKKILDKAGDDSYIGMAFHGCVDMARSNIDNDFANDPMEALEMARSRVEAARKEAEEYKEAYKALKERHEAEKEAHKSDLFQMQGRIDKAIAERDEAQRAACEKQCNREDYEAQIKAKDDEIIRLKAKLYDMMTA